MTKGTVVELRRLYDEYLEKQVAADRAFAERAPDCLVDMRLYVAKRDMLLLALERAGPELLGAAEALLSLAVPEATCAGAAPTAPVSNLLLTLQLVLDLDSEATEGEVVRMVTHLYQDQVNSVRYDAECVAKANGWSKELQRSTGDDAVARMHRILRGRAK